MSCKNLKLNQTGKKKENWSEQPWKFILFHCRAPNLFYHNHQSLYSVQIIIEYMYSCFGAIILFTLLFSRTIQIETIVRGRGGGGGQTLIHFVC